MENTIAAISTPIGKGAISIVRMSGKDSLNIAKKVFFCKDFFIQPRKLYLGNFNLGSVNEKCLAVYFKKPFSFTGEDMIEFQVHGGSALTKLVLQKLLDNGAKLAEPGEFSRRAFENGKISLDEAEAIADEINAESENELKASLIAAEGSLKNDIKKIQDSLTAEIAQIEATLDYPEEDIEKSTIEAIFKRLNQIKEEIGSLLRQSNNARFIEKGINVAIVGSPNVGKSSILNAILGQKRAIVTDIAGTTRDWIEEQTYYNGIKLNFIDTAGIRETTNKVEKIGVERSIQAVNRADVILLVLDGSKNINKNDKDIINLVKDKNYITLINKIDKPRVISKQKNEIEISALKKTNIENIKKEIYNKVISEEIDFSKPLITNARQISILKNCLNIIDDILNEKCISMDIIAMQIKSLWNELGKITGETENESIIDLIFTKFCLGK